MKMASDTVVVDPETSVRYTEVVLKISYAQVEEVLGKFSCKCYASASKGEVVSREATVHPACELVIKCGLIGGTSIHVEVT
jgi:hypothetical protein